MLCHVRTSTWITRMEIVLAHHNIKSGLLAWASYYKEGTTCCCIYGRVQHSIISFTMLPGYMDSAPNAHHLWLSKYSMQSTISWEETYTIVICQLHMEGHSKTTACGPLQREGNLGAYTGETIKGKYGYIHVLAT